MLSVQQFPSELLENIFRKVITTSNYKRDLFNCALVCQSWYSPACRVLYEKVVILNRSQMCFDLQRNNLGIFCKVIELNDGRNLKKKPSSDQYDQLFSYLPNLERVIIGYRNTLNDLTHLNRNANQIKYLKDLTATKYTGDILQAYYNCAFTYKQALRHMKLDAPGDIIIASSGKFGSIYTFLQNLLP